MKDFYFKDTICGIATPQGKAGIGIVRVSGPKSILIFKKFTKFSKTDDIKSRHAYFLDIFFDEKKLEKLDEGIVIFFKSPFSYTGEDIVEFQVHGNEIVLKKLLENFTKIESVRLSEPGEFTKRSYLNDKIDLIQAENIMNLINSNTELSLKKSRDNLSGGLSNDIKNFQKIIINILAEVEVNLDFYDDNDFDYFDFKNVYQKIENLIFKIEKKLDTFRFGQILTNGAKVVLAGIPNSGKSSIFNQIIGREKAIVTNIPGTTRDTIESNVNLLDIPINLVDTAGIREDSNDLVEKLGIAKSKSEIQNADLVLWVIDISNYETDIKYFKKLNISEKNILFVYNKIDLIEIFQENLFGKEKIFISSENNQNISELKTKIKNLIITEKTDETNIISTERQKNSLEKIKENLVQSKNKKDIELIAINLRVCLDEMSKLLGQTVVPDIMDTVFSDFCIGK